jgi:predicted nuclease of predicted toxin-antitoxin system
MKLKLDENLGACAAALLREAGCDVETALQEGLGGAPDDGIYAACCREKRMLLTLDLDFADPARFPPAACDGIVVFRLPARTTRDVLLALVGQFVRAREREPIDGNLWIVEPGRIRIRTQRA